MGTVFLIVVIVLSGLFVLAMTFSTFWQLNPVNAAKKMPEEQVQPVVLSIFKERGERGFFVPTVTSSVYSKNQRLSNRTSVAIAIESLVRSGEIVTCNNGWRVKYNPDYTPPAASKGF